MPKASIPPLRVLLPDDANAALSWASGELLARLAVPYEMSVAGHPGPDRLLLAIDRPLPEGLFGVEIRCDEGADDSLATVSRRLADGTFARHNVDEVAPGRRRIRLDLAKRQVAWLGRREEYGQSLLDPHGRTRFETCELASAGLADCPAADLLAEAVHEALGAAAREVGPGLPPRESPWPDGNALAVHLSHDVDTYKGRVRLAGRYLEWATRAAGAALLGRWLAARRNVRRIRQRLGTGTDPDYTLPGIMELERQHEARSTFYFFSSDRPDRRRMHTRLPYAVDHPHLADDLAQLAAGGWEVGVHGLYATYRDAEGLREERERLAGTLGEPVTGIREHFLRLAIPETWQAQEQAGFAYDATLGWTRVPGFRAATAVPFRIWDVGAGRALDLMEIPLTAMDVGVEETLGTDESAFDRLMELMEKCRRPGGVFSLLVHPSRFVAGEFPFWPAWMGRLLAMAKDNGYWVTSGKAIYEAVTAFRRQLARSASPA